MTKTEKQDVVEKIADLKKRRRKSKEPAFTEEELLESKEPAFTEEELLEFKEWKKSKSDAASMATTVTPSDDKIYRMWKEESRMVKGIFRCHEPPGGSVTFPFRKYKWDQTKTYEMTDGEVYEVPLAVARHLNQNCSYPVHSHILGPDGRTQLNTQGKKRQRMSFESTEFAM